MGQSLSTPEKILKYSRAGDYISLRSLLGNLQNHSREYRDCRERFLEARDDSGSTPLVLAAQRGSLQSVELLLQQGASLTHQNARPDGGSALHEAVAHRHEHVVDLLLRAGASPFVENSRGFTPMDFACSGRSVSMLRRMEQAAPFRGWVLMKVPRFGGLGSEWQRRWCVVSHRYPAPRARVQLTHVVLLAYKRTDATAPACRAWLDGASASEVYHPKAVARLEGHGPAQVGIKLHPKHEPPTGVYATGGGPSQPFTLFVRPDDGSQASIDSLQLLLDLVNRRGVPPTAQPSAAGAGGGSHQAAAAVAGPSHPSSTTRPPAAQQGQMASTPGDWNFSPLRQGAGSVLETDEAMARRLQQEYDAELAQHMETNPGAVPPPSSSEATPVSAAGVGGPFGTASSLPNYYPSIDYDQRHNSGSLPNTPGSRPTTAQVHAQPSQNMPSSSSAPSTLDGGAYPSPPRRPSAPPLINLDDSPGPSAPAVHTPAPAPAAAEEVCVVCMDSPATAGFLHGDSVHKCVCKDCAQMFKDQKRDTCPMCREKIQGYIMNVFG